MEVIILKNAESVAAMGGELVAELLRVWPAAVLQEFHQTGVVDPFDPGARGSEHEAHGHCRGYQQQENQQVLVSAWLRCLAPIDHFRIERKNPHYTDKYHAGPH